ncbi:hypothetical protein [Pararhizobium sp.]|uniref:hypothetical protein n=1 Tax=Pararhizobium sp. TaxID=1977563 RepID=UPI00271F558A|nr:hypothetical protein [Pararhizobium sp.]MDO9417016.1 hypothetical protein [Pararhizobium sp.]
MGKAIVRQLKGWLTLRFSIKGDEASFEIGWFWIALIIVLLLTSCHSTSDWTEYQRIYEQTR